MPIMTDGVSTLAVSDSPAVVAAMEACGYSVAATAAVGQTAVEAGSAPEEVEAVEPADTKHPASIPPKGAARPVWVEFAEGLGIDASEMKRDEIQAAVAEKLGK